MYSVVCMKDTLLLQIRGGVMWCSIYEYLICGVCFICCFCIS